MSSINRQSPSSTPSSTSSIDEALNQLNQQQKSAQTVNKLLFDESLSIFNCTSRQNITDIDQQQRAVHDNISFLASMAAASVPESSWQPTSYISNMNSQRKMQPMLIQPEQNALSSISSRNLSTNMHELMENLNEICYRGFDELSALIQDQRSVRFASSWRK